jgi:hypothetical protein
VKLPRKAAYFTIVAADAMTENYDDIRQLSVAQNLWLLATRLYSCKPNPIDGGGDYGWATLRAYCLDALSTQGSSDLSLEAADQLLSLLCELVPITSCLDSSLNSEGKTDDDGASQLNDDSNKEQDAASKDTMRASVSLEDADLKEAITTANQFAKNLRVQYNNLTAGSPLLVQQSKWAGEKPIPSIEVPLSHASALSTFLVSLKVVWPHMTHAIVTKAQHRCSERASTLRRAIPKTSACYDITELYGLNDKELPVYINSEIVIKPKPELELECVKKRIITEDSKGGGLETFYNPFAKKVADNSPIARVAEEDERIIKVSFGNRLALPLQIQLSQLEFDKYARIKTSAVSFVIPPKSTAFIVEYPLRIASFMDRKDQSDIDDLYTMEVKGVAMICLGQQIFLPLGTRSTVTPVIAESSRLHLFCPSDIKVNDGLAMKTSVIRVNRN